MIVRKQLQLLICTLQIIYLFGGEVNQLLIDVEENETTETDSSPRNEHFTTSSFNVNVEDTSSSTYPRVMKVSNNAEKFSHEITTITTTKGFDQTNHLLLDGKFQHVSTTTGTPNRLLNDDKNLMASLKIEPLPCNTTTTDYHNGTVRNLTIDAISTEWILLSWQPPSPYPYGTVTHQSFAYLINVCSSEKCYKATENNTRYNATNLDPCTEYKFTVKVIDDDTCLAKKLDDVDDDDDDDGLTLKAKTNYDITKIGEIQDLVVHTTVSTVSLKWKEPSKYPMCVQNYFITIRSDYNTTRNVSVENKEYIAENLDPCKEYYIIIKAVSYVVASDGRKITLKTNSPKSSKPQDPIVEASAFSLFIRWQPPKVGSMCITHYRVTINNDPKAKATTINSSKTNVTIDGLYACTAYTVQINAVDQDQNDGDMIVIDTKTMQTVSRPPILNESFVTTNSIMLSWKIEKGNSSCILTSLKAMCNYTSTAGHGYEITNGIVEVPINSCTQDEFFIVNSLIEGISPFTKYICWAYVVNEAGVSELSGLTSLTTSEDIPSTPTAAVVRNITYSQFEIAWDAPMYLPGILHEFEIIVKWEIRFSIPDWCCCDTLKSSNNTIYLNGSTFNFQYSSAIPYTNYTLKIKARTTAGWGNYSDDIVFQTPPGVPEMVSNFSYLIRNNEHDTNILDTILKWAFPCSPNGIIEYFNVFVNGTRINYAPHSFTIQQNISQTTTNQNDIISMNLKELRAEYNYTFEVSGKVKGVECLGTPARHVVLYPAGIPSQPNKDYVKSITIDPSKAQRSTTSATLLLPLFPDTNGNVTYYSILVSRIEHNTTASHTRFNLSNYTWPNISSWEEAMLQDFTIPYQATRLWWDPYPNYVADYGEVKAVKYTIGEDTNCKEFSSNINNNKRIYCNGPLKSNTWYHVRMRAFTRGGYADSTTFIIKTNAEINVGLVTGVIFGILFFGILTTMMLLIRKCSPQVIIRQCLHSDMSGSPVPTPFSKKKFIAHCQQLIDNPGKLSNEFQLLQTLSVDLQMPTNTACLQANRKKNKYPDILPYDFSRVKLQVIDNDPNTDYINASFIKGYSGEDEYIACQGPKEETTFDFWRMIEQYNVNLIVMLTDLIENGKEKCYQYFPIIKETFRYENMTIRCISELEYRSYTQRTLVLQKENEKRNITHLHFKEWPDHDVPEGFDSMINFCQIVRRNILVNKGYNIVVHCSAGVGRTGTLIAIDILLQHLRDNRKLDVFGTVYRLRHHRINMVQKESQYAYVYNCIKQVLKNPYCLKTYKPPPMDPLYKNTCRTTTRLKLYKTSQ